MRQLHLGNLAIIQDRFADLDRLVRANQALQHQSVPVELEYFFRDLLNLIFDWSLQNANDFLSVNAKAIDLMDTDLRVAVQVTVTSGATKIRTTLRKFVGAGYPSRFDRLIFVYPSLNSTTLQANFSGDSGALDFDAKRDCLDLSDLLRLIRGASDRSLIEKVAVFLSRELPKYDRTATIQVDATVEAVISIIEHMMEHEPTPSELAPDQEAKFARFVEHAAWLKMQYQANLDCFGTVEAAKRAVGLDAVRVSRIQGWLKVHSSTALTDEGGDARRAFDLLTRQVYALIRDHYPETEEMVIRYFLAEQLTRCNVFPNPC